MNHFTCADCGESKPVNPSGGTGYAVFTENGTESKICYECCGIRDAEYMRDNDRITLYLVRNDAGRDMVTNWPGTLEMPAGVQSGRHNIAGVRYDAWFRAPDGRKWWGVSYGDNTQLIHCRKLKAA